jgi:hypothetical protein
MEKQLPTIIICDLDGTGIGNVGQYQVSRYSLLNSIRHYGLKGPSLKETPKAYSISEKLIRPGFQECIKTLRANYPWCYIFIYTASEKKWALQEIQWIEKSIGIPFNRPIFTRSDCIIQGNGNIRKSLKKILPTIFKTITKQVTLTDEEKRFIIHNKLLIIDDNPVYIDGQEHVLLCSSYNFQYCEDILDGIDESIIQNPNIQSEYKSLLKRGLVHPYALEETVDAHSKRAKIHHWISKKCVTTYKSNQPYQHDGFWKKLRSILIKNHVPYFTPKVIKQIQEVIYPHLERHNS